jgi:proteasome lid subunit RPN8/RPN11
MKPFRISYRQWRRLYRRAYRAQQRDQSEVCGVFAVDESGRISIEFLDNESNRAGHFELSPRRISDARRNFRACGLRPVGLFHSHPISEAVPGPGDIERASINAVHMIVEVCGRTARMWRIVRRGRTKVAVESSLDIKRTPVRRQR